MNELLFAGNTVLPLLLLMSCGFLSRQLKLLNDSLVKGINQLIFNLFLPVNLFYSVLTTPYDTPVSGTVFWFIPVGLIVLFLLLYLIIPMIEKDKKKVGVMIQGMARANYAFFGIPLVAMLFPGQDTSIAALLVVVSVPVYNVMSVIALSIHCGGEVRISKILLKILKNPLIIGTVAGYILWMLRFQPPSFLKTTLSDLSKISTPLALFTLGGAIKFSSARKHIRQLIISISGKLIFAPLIFVSLAVLLGIRDVALACVMIAFGAPAAVSSFPMAQQMGGDGELAAEHVALSSVFAILTTFLFIFALKSLGLI